MNYRALMIGAGSASTFVMNEMKEDGRARAVAAGKRHSKRPRPEPDRPRLPRRVGLRRCRYVTEVRQGRAGKDPNEATTSHPALVSGMEDFKPVYDAVQGLESFHSLTHDPTLFQIATTLLGPNVLLQPSNIARFIFPTNLNETTPPHQNYVHIQGTPDVWTAWIPLGDCPRKLGGLSVLQGSHKAGIFPVSRSPGAGGLRSDTARLDGEWVSSPFQLGDVIFFHSHTVNRGLPNRSSNRLRLSVDYRYQKASGPVMELLLGVHQGLLSWEEVYTGWKSEKYQYHWKRFSLNPVSKHPWPVAEAAAQEMKPPFSGSCMCQASTGKLNGDTRMTDSMSTSGPVIHLGRGGWITPTWIGLPNGTPKHGKLYVRNRVGSET